MTDCVAAASDVIAAIREAVPAGRMTLTDADRARLAPLTRALAEARSGADEEVRRFHSIGDRSLALDDDEVRAWIAGKSVLVTGGTGCIGSALLDELANYGAARITSLSRGQTIPWRGHEAVAYLHADVSDGAGLAAVFERSRPDLVFHLAAQRDPGLAEREVQRTIATNLLGTVLVARACAGSGAAELVSASTGKALRPYSGEVYTATKRVAEWALASTTAGSGLTVAACRFTHVVENSIVHRRLLHWARGGVVRLHDPDAAFYVQSARESARLMLATGVRAGHPTARLTAIRNLGWPIGLLDLALGTLREQRSASPVYFSGHDPGYESVPFAGLYDPATAGDLSPLLSVFDTAAGIVKDGGIDIATLIPQPGAVTDELVNGLVHACRHGDPAVARSALDELSWQAFDATLAELPRPALQRIVERTEAHADVLSCDHIRMLARIRDFAGSADHRLAETGVRS